MIKIISAVSFYQRLFSSFSSSVNRSGLCLFFFSIKVGSQKFFLTSINKIEYLIVFFLNKPIYLYLKISLLLVYFIFLVSYTPPIEY